MGEKLSRVMVTNLKTIFKLNLRLFSSYCYANAVA